MSKDLGKRQVHHYYFKDGLMDFMAGWMLGYTQLGAASVGEMFDCLNKIKNGDPESWVLAFDEGLSYQLKEAAEYKKNGDSDGAAIKYLAATVMARAAMSFCDPQTKRAVSYVEAMESSFQQYSKLVSNGLIPHDFDYHGKQLPAYISERFDETRPLLLVIGGGDSSREDLFFFGGKGALERNYNLVMVDLPGQGKTPAQGLHFGQDTIDALSTVIDQIEELGFHGDLVMMGYSGGGYFTCKAVENEKRVKALVASTPVISMKEVVERAIPSLLVANLNSPIAKLGFKFTAFANKPMGVAFKKYIWQFGPNGIADFLAAMDVTGPVDPNKITIPVYGVVGLGEDEESGRQARRLMKVVKQHQPTSALIYFPPESGADAHCQVNNLRLGQHHMYRWLEEIGY